jgi:hypothetical protein
MSVAETSTIYCGLTDEALEREIVVLTRKVSALRLSTTATGITLHTEFVKRLDQANAEFLRRQV